MHVRFSGSTWHKVSYVCGFIQLSDSGSVAISLGRLFSLKPGLDISAALQQSFSVVPNSSTQALWNSKGLLTGESLCD